MAEIEEKGEAGKEEEDRGTREESEEKGKEIWISVGNSQKKASKYVLHGGGRCSSDVLAWACLGLSLMSLLRLA